MLKMGAWVISPIARFMKDLFLKLMRIFDYFGKPFYRRDWDIRVEKHKEILSEIAALYQSKVIKKNLKQFGDMTALLIGGDGAYKIMWLIYLDKCFENRKVLNLDKIDRLIYEGMKKAAC